MPAEGQLLAQTATLEEWKRMQLIYNAALKEINTKLEILNSEFQMAHRYNPIEHITARIKSPESIAKKLRHQGRALTMENIVRYINDVAGIRIICSFTSDIYQIAELIRKQSDVTILKIKDYIASPKENGYTSYHMIVSVPIFLSDMTIDTKVEIQIRTIAMDFWASLEHKMYYKFEGNAPENIRRELKECADLVGFLDRKMLAINEEIKKYSDEEEEEELISETLQNLFGRVSEEENEAAGTATREQDKPIVIDLQETEIRQVGNEQKKKILSMSRGRKISAK
ncbi:MAG: GTP pyrophosphokinase family protein [Lachnospiraceae bacterium]|nr:GTP pyrophosphokinase family protein [Lachnospiraceae bacterium]